MLVIDMMPKFLRRLLAGALVLYSARVYAASPCDGLHKHLTTEQTRFYELQSEKQLGVAHTELLDVFRFSGWVMLYAGTRVSDNVILLYHADRGRTRFVTTWGGGAPPTEQPALEAWMHKNAPGVPNTLARCFAWYVTLGRTQ